MAGETMRPDYVNLHDQKVIGPVASTSNHRNQRTYELKCWRCDNRYGANGFDIHIRRCPECQAGKPGLALA